MRARTNRFGAWLAAIAGLAAVLAGLEVGLRVVGRVHRARATADSRTRSAAGQFVVLCLGDSFTYGSGAPAGMSYPAQLERRLRELYPDRETVVVNRGVGCANTRVLLDGLESNLSAAEPDAVLLMAGVANLWNLYGFDDFAAGRGTVAGKLRNCLYRLRLFKLVKLLFRDIAGPAEDETESAFYPLAGNDPGSVRYPLRKRQERTERELAPDSPEYLSARGRHAYFAGEADAAIEWFERGVREHPRDPEAYTWLNECLIRKGRAAQSALRLKAALKLSPDLSVLYAELSRALFAERDYVAAASAALDGAQRFPLDRGAFDAFIGAFKQVRGREEQKRLSARLSGIDGALASEFLVYARRIEKGQLEDLIPVWVEADLKEIIAVCRERGVRVLVATYPHDAFLSPSIKSAAASGSARLVDLNYSFSLFPPRRHCDFFSPDGHCNAEGYTLVAGEFAKALACFMAEGGKAASA